MKTNSVLMMLLFSTMLISSCKKDDEPNPDVNAQAQAFTFTITPNDWTSIGTYGTEGFGYAISKDIAAINQQVFDNGAVLGYITPPGGNGNVWFQVPFTLSFDTWETHYELAHQVGSAQLVVFDSDLKTAIPFADVKLKIVVIEALTGKRNVLDGINTANYLETMNALGLQP